MSSRAHKTETRLTERCKSLAELVKQVRPIYQDSNISDNQKAFIETTIGAAIFYLSSSKQFWTGKMSIKAVESYLPDKDVEPQYVEDHEYPRKIAGADLLASNTNEDSDLAAEVYLKFKDIYSRVNYITSAEHASLKKHHKKGKFVNPMDAYEKADIHLVEITKEQLREIKARNRNIIEEILKYVI